MATCSSCGKVCIIQQERSFTTAADSCDVQLTLDDSQTPGVLSASLVVDDDPTNLLVPGTCGWSVPEAAVISVIDANICTILSDQSISCFGDVDTTTTPPTSGQFMAWNGTQWVPATLPAGTAVNIEDANGNVTVLNGNGNIQTDCTMEVSGGTLGVRRATFIVGPNIAGSTSIIAGAGWQLVASLVIPAIACDRNMRTDFEITIGFNGSPAPALNDQARFRVLLNGVQIGTQTGVYKPNSSASTWGYELDYDRYFTLPSGVTGTLTYEADWIPAGAVSGNVLATIQEPKVMEII